MSKTVKIVRFHSNWWSRSPPVRRTPAPRTRSRRNPSPRQSHRPQPRRSHVPQRAVSRSPSPSCKEWLRGLRHRRSRWSRRRSALDRQDRQHRPRDSSASTPTVSTARSPSSPSPPSLNIPPTSPTKKAPAIWMQYLTAYGGLIIWAISSRETSSSSPPRAAASASPPSRLPRQKAPSASRSHAPRQRKLDLLELGADHVIVTNEEDLVARVNEITSGTGARIIFDPMGGKILDSRSPRPHRKTALS